MIPAKDNKQTAANWLMWWRQDPEKIAEQVDNYKSLRFGQSLRSRSLVLIIFSAGITNWMIESGRLSESAYWDMGALLFSAFFSWLSQRWAIVLLMVLWTFEKICELYLQPAFAIPVLIWWTSFMHVFYGAFLVEKQRRFQSNNLKVDLS